MELPPWSYYAPCLALKGMAHGKLKSSILVVEVSPNSLSLPPPLLSWVTIFRHTMLVHRLRMIPRSLGWAYRFNIYITKPKDLLDLSLIHHRRVDNIHPLLAPLVISKCKRPPQQDKHWNGMAWHGATGCCRAFVPKRMSTMR